MIKDNYIVKTTSNSNLKRYTRSSVPDNFYQLNNNNPGPQAVNLPIANATNFPKQLDKGHKINSPEANYSRANKTKKKKIKLKKIDNIDVEYDYLDICLPVDQLYTYISENGLVKTSYYKSMFVFFFFALVMVALNIVSFLVYTRVPSMAYKYECFKLASNSYDRCTQREWCICSDTTKCATVCYKDSHTCINYFRQSSEGLTKNGVYGPIVHIKYQNMAGTNINVFRQLESGQCDVKAYSFYITLSFFLGGVVGCAVFGLLAESYGKKKILIVQSVILSCSYIIISVYSFTPFNLYSNINYFLCIWCICAALVGSCLLSMEYKMYLQFMETLPHINYIGSVNGYFHLHFGAVGLISFILFSIMQNYSIIFTFSAAYFAFFPLIYHIYFPENPRYYSERKEYNLKKNAIKKFLIKTKLCTKVEDNNEKTEKQFYKITYFFDSRKVKIVNNKRVKINKKEEQTEGGLNKSNKTNLTNTPALNLNSSALPNLSNLSNLESFNNIRFNTRTNRRKRNSNVPLNSEINSNNKLNELKYLNENENYKNEASKIKKVKINEKIEICEENEGDKYKYDLKDIIYSCRSDKFLKKNLCLLIMGWMGINYCFYGTAIGMILDMTNPNNIDEFRSVQFILYAGSMCCLLPVIGRISYFFPPDKILKLSLFLYSMVCFNLDSYAISPNSERGIYFGDPTSLKQYTLSLPYKLATCSFFIVLVYCQMDVMTMSGAPTFYRTLTFSVCKIFSKVTAAVAFLTKMQMDAPGMNLGIVAFFTFLMFFWVDVKWKEIGIEDYVDLEQGLNRRRKISRQKVGVLKNADKSRSHSMFKKLRNLSVRKMNAGYEG